MRLVHRKHACNIFMYPACYSSGTNSRSVTFLYILLLIRYELSFSNIPMYPVTHPVPVT